MVAWVVSHDLFGPGVAPMVSLSAFVACFVASWVSGLRCSRLRCPRCGVKFFGTGWVYNRDAWECVGCGLPKFAPNGLCDEGIESKPNVTSL